MANAYAGRVLWVDLSHRLIRHEPTQHYAEWIGGRGMGAYLASRIPALFSDDPAEQPVVLATGPLVAAGVPLGVRTALTARNQLSGGMCYSNVGGDFGTRLKMAGYDAVVIEGHSSTPVYLLVTEGRAALLPAEHLWGLLLSDFREAMLHEHSRDDLSYICIGPAGEHRAGVSCLMVDHAHATGWGGSGLVFDAKKLKAIVAIGDNPVSVFDAD
ncbi:MAG: aldehyde ferredoxin oxidoreductase N-terminal domain-containing protein, partial [Spirochaetota bacterium]